MKMYRIDQVIEVLSDLREEENNFAGFDVSDEGNLLIIAKEHEPNWVDEDGFGEAITEVELVEDVGDW